MAVVVRCTGCSGLARVGPEAVGLLVVCPRCGDPFLADPVPETPVAAPPPPPPPPVRALPVEPPRPRRRRPPAETHDHPPPDAGGVPFSVIVGLALLPLTIPLLWLIGPVAVGNPPALSLATPASLALAAAVLCLAVAYTVDWTPVARIKGVLTLVGLAYFAGLSLYFMKQEWAEWAQDKLGSEVWRDFRPADGEYEVRLPGEPKAVPAKEAMCSLPPLRLTSVQVRTKGLRPVTYQVAAGPDHDPEADDAAWFAVVEQSLQGAAAKRAFGPGRAGEAGGRVAYREWVSAGRRPAMIVRVYRDRDRGRAFLLAAQAIDLDPDDDAAARFFESFVVRAGQP